MFSPALTKEIKKMKRNFMLIITSTACYKKRKKTNKKDIKSANTSLCPCPPQNTHLKEKLRKKLTFLKFNLIMHQ